MPATRSLFTVSYEGTDLPTFIERLHVAGVRTLVDVRELPLSRKPGFSKRSLSDALLAADVAYVHMPALGCPRWIRDRYRTDRDWQLYTRDFLQHLRSCKSSVHELLKLSRAKTVALMCFEADFSMCHRTYVARAVAHAGGPPIHHLTAKTVVPDSTLRHAA